MQKLEKKKLDEIGKALVKARAVPERELEEIIADPELFRSIRARIGSERPALRRPIFRPGLVAFASVVLIAIVAAAFVAFRPESGAVVHTPSPPPVIPEVRQFREPDRIADPEFPPVL